MKPYYEHGGIRLYHGDCREVLPEITEPIGVVVTDPPYTFGIASTHDEGKAGGWGDLMNSAGIYAGWLEEWRRLLRGGGAAWVFNSWRSFPVLARAAHEAAWPICSLLVWDKGWIGPGGPRGLRPSYEVVALFASPEFRVVDRSTPDVWREKWSGHKPNGHPAEKPVPLLRRLVTAGGEGTVLDPFSGSGSTLVAARKEGREAIGVEIEERWCEATADRLAEVKLW